MTSVTEEGLLCHCEHDPDGHPVEKCGTKLGRRTQVGFPALRTYGGAYGTTLPMPIPTGTCPRCGRTGVKVELRAARTARDGHDLMPGIPLANVPALAAHRRPGKRAGRCPGRGYPGETRFSFPEVEAMIRDYGPASVQVDGVDHAADDGQLDVLDVPVEISGVA